MSRGINKVIIVDLYRRGLSIPQVSNETGLARSTVRHHLSRAGVLRSRADGVRMAAKDGRLGGGLRGRKRIFSEDHKAKIADHRRAWGELNAKGFSVKPNGYAEVTRGPNKGRGLHRVVAEQKIGRRLRGDEVVHHLDGNPLNNEPGNLEVMTHSEHCRLHAAENHINRDRDNLGRFA